MIVNVLWPVQFRSSERDNFKWKRVNTDIGQWEGELSYYGN